MPDLFEKRIRRADTLLREWEFAAHILSFFKPLAEIQQEMFALFEESPPDHERRREEVLLLRLLETVRERGPSVLSERAKEMDLTDLRELQLRSRGGHGDPPAADTVEGFFVRVMEQPDFARNVRLEGLDSSKHPGLCPFCELPPLVSVLREDKQADTVRRTLLCPRCCNEWDFPRVLCPNCKEERPEKLPRYSAQEIPWMRVEACDTCKTYLKSVDLTLNWEADPFVDELASMPLDVIAREQGYTKLVTNLAGI